MGVFDDKNALRVTRITSGSRNNVCYYLQRLKTFDELEKFYLVSYTLLISTIQRLHLVIPKVVRYSEKRSLVKVRYSE